MIKTMKTVKIYHVIAVVAILLMAITSTLTGNINSILIIGFGTSIVLLLGIHLVLDRQERNLYQIERKLLEISSEVESTKMTSELASRLSNEQQVAIIRMLSEIHEPTPKKEDK